MTTPNLDTDALDEVTMAEALRLANGEKIVLARTIRRAITHYQQLTTAPRPVEYRWTDTDGILHNRDGLVICGDLAHDGARCIREKSHQDPLHYYRERTIQP